MSRFMVQNLTILLPIVCPIKTAGHLLCQCFIAPEKYVAMKYTFSSIY